MAQTVFGPSQFVRDRGSSCHWRLIIAPCQAREGWGAGEKAGGGGLGSGVWGGIIELM